MSRCAVAMRKRSRACSCTSTGWSSTSYAAPMLTSPVLTASLPVTIRLLVISTSLPTTLRAQPISAEPKQTAHRTFRWEVLT